MRELGIPVTVSVKATFMTFTVYNEYHKSYTSVGLETVIIHTKYVSHISYQHTYHTFSCKTQMLCNTIVI